MLDRRKFTKLAILSGTSLAASSGIFFPKPTEAQSFDFLLTDENIKNIFFDLVRAIAAKLNPELAFDIESTVKAVNTKFFDHGYTQNQTPFAQRGAGSRNNNPLWGRYKNEAIAPNFGLANVDTSGKEATFTGPTIVGIKVAADYLAAEGLSPDEIDSSLMPWRSRFEDWTTWLGDNDPTIGPNPGVGLTQYETRLGLVTRRYDALDPSSGKVGKIRMTIEAANQPRRVITTDVSV
ncbi:MAG: Tat pathway signal protein [Okeania sp. SIO2F4]|uniref:Tat pathway signal protein n=1 Tax=Okeania sp. SIO2F4 TaxID=2607790 RepID=UPI00142914E5|nr:Tat pathway signal protein [Okeania sp. SIO2F4]NES02231.1 Tat pathway signal protein [Okeania sp. SIO2F4]